MITGSDDLYSAFKHNRHTNFKQGLVNTLGAFESGSVYTAVRKWQAVIATAYRHNGGEDDSKRFIELMTSEESKSGFASPEYEQAAAVINTTVFDGLLSKIGRCLAAVASVKKIE